MRRSARVLLPLLGLITLPPAPLIAREGGVVAGETGRELDACLTRLAGVGFSLLGIIVERVSGMGYEEFLREHLFGPAGMTRTGYLLDRYAGVYRMPDGGLIGVERG